MKKLKAFWGKIPHPLQEILIVFIVGLVLYLIILAPCRINRFRVQSITMTSENGPVLSKSDASKLIFIVNSSTFRASRPNYDTCPTYRFVVTYRNGEHLEIYDYGQNRYRLARYGKDGRRKMTYHVRGSNWLDSYAKELHDQQYGIHWPSACEY